MNPCASSACPYNAIIKQERPCTKACGMNAIGSDEYGRAEIDQDKCVSCGQCLVSCPFSAIVDKGQIFQTIMALKSESPVYAILAPAIAGQFEGLENTKIRGAFQALGFTGSGGASVYGNILLSFLVYDGEEAFPGAGEMHLHGTDSDGSDCETDQAERA